MWQAEGHECTFTPFCQVHHDILLWWEQFLWASGGSIHVYIALCSPSSQPSLHSTWTTYGCNAIRPINLHVQTSWQKGLSLPSVIPQSHLLRRPYGLTFLWSVEILRLHTLAVTFAMAAVRHIFNLWRQKNCGCPTSFEVMTHGRRRASLRQP